MDLFTLSAALTLNSAEFNAGLKAAEQQGQSSAGAFGKMADGIKKAFNFAAVTQAIGTVVTNIYEVGTAYDTAFAKVGTIADASVMNMDQMSAAILNLSKETGVAATEISESVYQAISGGVNTADAVSTVNTAVMLAKGGFTDTATAIDILTTATNAYAGAAGSMEHISNVLITTQNKGKTSVGDLAANMGKVIPTASAYNVSIENLGAAYAVLTAAGVNTAQSTTELNSMFLELGDSGTNVAKILKDKTGKSFGELMSGGADLSDVMGVLLESVDGDINAFNELWSSSTAGAAALTLANAGADQFKDTLGAMIGSAGATQEAYDKMSATVGEKTAVLGNLLTVTGQKIFNSVSPMIVSALDAIAEPAAQMLDGVATAVDGAVQWMGNVGTAFTEAMENGFDEESVGGIFDAMFGEDSLASNALTGIVTAGGQIFDGIGQALATGDRSAITNAVDSVFGKDSLIANGINTVINLGGAMFDGISNILSAENAGDAIKAAFDMVFGSNGTIATLLNGFGTHASTLIAAAWNFITGDNKTASDIQTWFTNTFNDANTAITNAFAAVGEFFGGVWDGIKGAFQNAVAWFTTTFNSVWTGIKLAFAGAISFFAGIWDGIKGAFQNAATWFTTIFKGAWTGIKTAFASAGTFFEGIWNSIASAFSSAGSWFVENVQEPIVAVWNAISGAINSAISAILSFMGIQSRQNRYGQSPGKDAQDLYQTNMQEAMLAAAARGEVNLSDQTSIAKWTGNYRLNHPDSRAVGLDYVPYDGYLAELHQGEAVLTAAEAATLRNNGGLTSFGSSGNSNPKPQANPKPTDPKKPKLLNNTGVQLDLTSVVQGILDDYWAKIKAARDKLYKPAQTNNAPSIAEGENTRRTGNDETNGLLQAMGETAEESIGESTSALTETLTGNTQETLDQMGRAGTNLLEAITDGTAATGANTQAQIEQAQQLSDKQVQVNQDGTIATTSAIDESGRSIETVINGTATTVSRTVADAVARLGVSITQAGISMTGEGYEVATGAASNAGMSTYEKRLKLLQDQMAWEQANGIEGGLTQYDIDAWIAANKDRKYFNQREKAEYLAQQAAEQAAQEAAQDPARLKAISKIASTLANSDQAAADRAAALINKYINKEDDAMNGSHALGLRNVPFDGYIAELHRGEGVLTQYENNRYLHGMMDNMSAGIDYNRLAQAVAGAIQGLSVRMDGQTVGDIVTETVSRNIARSAGNLRYAR